MKIQQTHLQNANLWNAEKYAAHKSMTAVQPHTVNYAAELTISEEGRQALKEKVRELSPEIEEEDFEFATTKNTNFVEFEHYMALRELHGTHLEGKEYDVKDVMASVAEAYETLYNEIWEQHKNGGRQVTYDILGECSVTLEEDLEGLNKAYERCLANLEGYITAQQTNKAFANPDMEWWFRRHPELRAPSNENKVKNNEKEQDDYNYFDEEYKKTAVSIMKQTREQFLSLFWGPNYQQGAMKDIVAQIMNENDDFMEKTQKLFS